MLDGEKCQGLSRHTERKGREIRVEEMTQRNGARLVAPLSLPVLYPSLSLSLARSLARALYPPPHPLSLSLSGVAFKNPPFTRAALK